MTNITRRTAAATAAAAFALPAAAAEVKPMASTDFVATYHALIKDWQRQDIDAVLARVTDDLEWHYLVGLPPLKGKAAMREFLVKFGKGMHDVKWRIFDVMTGKDRIMVEGVDEYTNEAGNRVAVPYMGIYEFRDGLICRWRDYCDSGLAGRLKNGEAVPAYVDALIDRKAV